MGRSATATLIETPFWRLKHTRSDDSEARARPGSCEGSRESGRGSLSTRRTGLRTRTSHHLLPGGAADAAEHEGEEPRVVHAGELGRPAVGTRLPGTPPEHVAFEAVEAPRDEADVLARPLLDVQVHPAG